MKCKFKYLRPVLFVAVALALPATATIAPTPERIGRYDFSYQIQAHSRVTPVQVFDDGVNTYFQFNGGGAVPAIFRVTEFGPELTIQTFEGPYLRVDGTAAQFLLRLGSASGSVTYMAAGRRGGAPGTEAVPALKPLMAPTWKAVVASSQPVAFTPSEAQPRALETNSYATPAKGDVIEWAAGASETEEHEYVFAKDSSSLSGSQLARLRRLAKSLSGNYKVVIIGRDDDGLKEGTAEARARFIAQALVKSGVRQSLVEGRIGGAVKSSGGWATHVRVIRTPIARQATRGLSVAPQAPLEAPPDGFALLVSDRNIAAAVNRWARATSYQIVWDAPEAGEPEINANYRLSATSMREAIDLLVQGMRAKGYDVNATIYKNRVVRLARGR